MSLNLYFTIWKEVKSTKKIGIILFYIQFWRRIDNNSYWIGGYFEPAGPLWCWIASNHSVAEFALLYIVTVFCLILIIILWSLVIYKIRQLVSFQRERAPLLSGSAKLSPILF